LSIPGIFLADSPPTTRLSLVSHNPTADIRRRPATPGARKTDGTELQKPPNRKFFYSFIYNDLRRSPPKKSPEFRTKRAGRSKYGGRLLFAPGQEYRDEYKN
jgi:hypothetical protein